MNQDYSTPAFQSANLGAGAEIGAAAASRGPGNIFAGGQADARQGAGSRPEGTFRKRYRQLSAADIAHHDAIKDTAEVLLSTITAAYDAMQTGSPEIQRCRALAKTKLEESVMWAVRGLTA